MKIELLAHTRLSESFKEKLYKDGSISFDQYGELDEVTDGQVVTLSAIRTCYSANKPSEIAIKEGHRYFKKEATDGKGGTDADRLIRHIVASKHTSTLEAVTFTFAIEGVSRALLAQLTRHRVGFSFSVQSQRYVRFGSDDKSGGFDYVVPDNVKKCESESVFTTYDLYNDFMDKAQEYYDELRAAGVPAEDARMVLPQAATTNLVMTVNLRSLLDFYAKRRAGNGAQAEIAELAEKLRKEVVKVEPWVDEFFEGGRN
ncbi:FAD-dependent thymidylate synthase [Bacillus sp. XF8]|uniref:FAD-dependent thymidylate synthase n=1 Tax=Bacillus sp. XF8 TaxID=2819289 RepID=UPI001AA061B9|nr:FAD-dependent thymidylate synthase [Bacillus sp. XF8]MBO1582691.1 FAD-dependent thymidylate synthase [Bacillus sp. XF8]